MNHSAPPLHDYQRLGVRYLHNHDRCALFLDMGLGKTATVLTALEPRHLPVLVVAPKRVAQHVWPEEARLWRRDLRLVHAVGTPAQRARILQSDADIIVIGRDNLRDAISHAKRFKTFIMDEMSSFKNRQAARWAAAHKIAQKVPHVWGLTGTPAPNGLLDLWAQIRLLDGGERLGKYITHYRGRYFVAGRQLSNGVVTEWNLRDGADAKIHALLEDITLAMKSNGRVDVAEPVFNRVRVDLPPKARTEYKRMKDDLVNDLTLIGGEIHTAANAAVVTSKLSQMTAGAILHDDADLRGGTYDVVHHEKVRAVREIVDGNAGQPVVVFYWFKAELELLKAEFGPDLHTLDEEDVVMAWNAGKVPVLALHPLSAGHGLNLQHGGHIAVWTTLPMMNLEAWQQANKRLARQGQKHQVVVHVLEVPRTVDVVQWDRLVLKKSVQDALTAHLESPI